MLWVCGHRSSKQFFHERIAPMKSFRSIGLLILLLTFVSIVVWQGKEGSVEEVGNPNADRSRSIRERPETLRSVAPSEASRGRAKLDKECSMIVRNVSDELMVLERGRISDRVSSKRTVRVDEVLRKSHQIPLSISSIEFDMTYHVIDAPALDERERIEELIRDRLSLAPFADEEKRKKAEKLLTKKFLNFRKSKKLVQTYSMKLPDRDEAIRWVTAFDTDQVMEWGDGENVSLGSQNHSGYEHFKDGPKGGLERYGHLTSGDN